MVRISMSKISASAMREGVENQFQRMFFLNTLSDQEIEEAIGKSITEKIKEGFKFGVIIFPVFAPFFTSLVENIVAERDGLISENGGKDKVEFHLIERTGEVIVLLKPNPLDL